MGVVFQQLTQVRCDNRAAVNHDATSTLCFVAIARVNPYGIKSEGGIFGLNPLKITGALTRIDRQFTIGVDLTLTRYHVMQADVICVRG